MPAEIIATGSTTQTSADIVVTAGTSLIVALKDVSSERAPHVRIELFDGVTYNLIGRLNDIDSALVINAPGTYRFIRTSGTCGVFSG